MLISTRLTDRRSDRPPNEAGGAKGHAAEFVQRRWPTRPREGLFPNRPNSPNGRELDERKRARVRMLRSANSHSDHVRMLAALDGVAGDLRSELLKSYGRDEFANYDRNILEAIEVWRQLGVWRVPSTSS